MSIVLLYAGEKFSVSLQGKLKEIHDANRVSVLGEIMRRKDRNTPLDGLEDPGDYVPREGLEGLVVNGVILSAKELRQLGTRHATAVAAWHEDAADKVVLADAIYEAKKALVAAVVESVDGFAGEKTSIAVRALPSEVADAFERVQIIIPLYKVAAAMQELTAKKA